MLVLFISAIAYLLNMAFKYIQGVLQEKFTISMLSKWLL